MRILIITLLFVIICLLPGISFSSEQSECLNSCEKDKRASDMYCPPSGGFTDQDNKQCLAKNSADLKSCKNACSPIVNLEEEPQLTPAEISEKTPDDSAPEKKQY